MTGSMTSLFCIAIATGVAPRMLSMLTTPRTESQPFVKGFLCGIAVLAALGAAPAQAVFFGVSSGTINSFKDEESSFDSEVSFSGSLPGLDSVTVWVTWDQSVGEFNTYDFSADLLNNTGQA